LGFSLASRTTVVDAMELGLFLVELSLKVDLGVTRIKAQVLERI